MGCACSCTGKTVMYNTQSAENRRGIHTIVSLLVEVINLLLQELADVQLFFTYSSVAMVLFYAVVPVAILVINVMVVREVHRASNSAVGLHHHTTSSNSSVPIPSCLSQRHSSTPSSTAHGPRCSWFIVSPARSSKIFRALGVVHNCFACNSPLSPPPPRVLSLPTTSSYTSPQANSFVTFVRNYTDSSVVLVLLRQLLLMLTTELQDVAKLPSDLQQSLVVRVHGCQKLQMTA